jgi:hypothetical protein
MCSCKNFNGFTQVPGWHEIMYRGAQVVKLENHHNVGAIINPINQQKVQ